MAMKAAVISAEGKKGRAKNLPEAIFDGTVHEPAMWQTVKAHLANRRQGNASTKNRSAVQGGNHKPWRQKGTGRARQGSIRSPQWAGGGVVFGPTPDRNHTQKITKKLKALAHRSALNARAQDGRVFLYKALELDAPKTKRVVQLIAATEASGNVLVLTDGHQPVFHRSARNLPNVEVRPFGSESAYDVLWAETVLIEDGALDSAKAKPSSSSKAQAQAQAQERQEGEGEEEKEKEKGGDDA